MKINKIAFLTLVISFGLIVSCGGNGNKTVIEKPDTPIVEEPEEEVDPMDNVGIGPVDGLLLADLNDELALKGKEVFDMKCSACHKTTKRFIGPNVTGVMERRNPAWVMNMILNPEEMVEKDPIARQLLMEYSAPMANQNLSKEEARSVVEYFRTLK